MDPFEQHLIAGGELLRSDRIREACGEFRAALELREDDPRALGLLGLTYFRMADFRAALPVYRKLVERMPDDASYRLNLGLVHLKVGDAQEAIDQLFRSRELDPSQARTVSYLGLAYARAGRYDHALQAFLQAGQDDLAREMEQHLSPEERDAIHRQVRERAAEADAAAVPEPAEDPAPAGDNTDRVDAAEAAAPEVPAAEESGEGAVSRAVNLAVPSSAARAAATRTAAGHQPPQAVSEYATVRLIRPEDGQHAFEIGAGGVLIVRVRERTMSRTEGVIVSGGELAYEPATRHARGASAGEVFGGDDRPLFIITGNGHLVAAPLGEHFAAVSLDDDILYLREDLVFAFEDVLQWENGHVPGSESRIPVVQFRGRGCVALRTRRPLLSVKLMPERVLYVDAEVLGGWIGRVVPRVVAPAAGGDGSAPFVECTGEGVVLLDDPSAGES